MLLPQKMLENILSPARKWGNEEDMLVIPIPLAFFFGARDRQVA